MIQSIWNLEKICLHVYINIQCVLNFILLSIWCRNTSYIETKKSKSVYFISTYRQPPLIIILELSTKIILIFIIKLLKLLVLMYYTVYCLVEHFITSKSSRTPKTQPNHGLHTGLIGWVFGVQFSLRQIQLTNRYISHHQQYNQDALACMSECTDDDVIGTDR